MNDELRTLWALHELDDRLVQVQEVLRRHPAERRAAETAVEAEQARLAAHQQRIAELRTSRRLIEQDIELLGGEEKRFQGQLPMIKKNEEYQALLHEISDRRTKRSDLETEVLIRMEEEEQLAGALPGIDKALAEARAAADARIVAVAAAEQKERSEAESLEERRVALLPSLPPGTRTRYERIRESLGGRAVVPIMKGACGGCFRGQPPQVLQEARRGDRLLVCDGCGRLLVNPPDGA
jgi:predicted  nucleic acid-binding Zn-ribbon protein